MIKMIKEYFLIKELKRKLELIPDKKILFITGAGVSIDSGILPFRGSNGIYTQNPQLQYLLRPDSFETQPEALYNFHQDFKIDLKNKKPNALHHLINKIGHKIITQNIDNLFEKAGRFDVIHIHGSVSETICRNCKIISRNDFKLETPCKSCNKPMLRHRVVLFKESLLHMDLVYGAILECNILIQIGTSGTIYPVANLPRDFKGLKIIINPDKPQNHLLFDNMIIGNPIKILGKLFK